MQRLKLLIIDDDEDDFFLTSQLLKQITDISIESVWCSNTSDAISAMVSNSYDLYFVDYLLGAKTGLELIKEAIALGAQKPLILLTGMGSVETDKTAVSIGAYDYLKKDELSVEKLERCIRYSIERYKNYKTIRDSEKKYRLIFEHAFSFVFICDNQFVFSETNNGCEFMLGYSVAEIKSKKLFDLLLSDDSELQSNLNRQQKLINRALRFKTKSGELRRGTLSMSYFEETELPAFWLGVLHDDTWRIEAENSKLQIEKLNATQRLVRTLAHEIRNPLTNMSLAINGLEDFEMSVPQQEYLDILRRSGIRINSILAELLQSSNEIDLVRTETDLRDIIETALQRNQDRIVLKRINVSLELPNNALVAKVDADKFVIAISNLLVNAIEAVAENTGHLSITLQQENSDFKITIADNGVGIHETQMSSLFEPFYTTKRNGVGLGLVATLNILKSHKAQVQVKSEPGLGTAFSVTLPI